MLPGALSRRDGTPFANAVEPDLGPGLAPVQQNTYAGTLDILDGSAARAHHVMVWPHVRVVADLARDHSHGADEAELFEQGECVVDGGSARRRVVPGYRREDIVCCRVGRGGAQEPRDGPTWRSPRVPAAADAGFDQVEIRLLHRMQFSARRSECQGFG